MNITTSTYLRPASKFISDAGLSYNNLGLGYFTLGEATSSLSGGEAQRLKLAT